MQRAQTGAGKTVYLAETMEGGFVNAAPITFFNNDSLKQYLTRGGFAALVDVTAGSVTCFVTTFAELKEGNTYVEKVCRCIYPQ